MSSRERPFNRCGLSHCPAEYSTAPVVMSSVPIWLALASHASELSQCSGLPKIVTIVVIFRVTPLYGTVVSSFHRRFTDSSWLWQCNIINSRIQFSDIKRSRKFAIDTLSIHLENRFCYFSKRQMNTMCLPVKHILLSCGKGLTLHKGSANLPISCVLALNMIKISSQFRLTADSSRVFLKPARSSTGRKTHRIFLAGLYTA